MLSDEEKKEILSDAGDAGRREHFRSAKEYNHKAISLDEYVSFLDTIQKIFMPFAISSRPTPTRFNRL